ncbi:unnamed protein product [Phytophthora lilii]|uniref:Unnamed protein product n=1 Tax=Phytophthora lilii TaxID=2077276 RepID=A0A9W6U5M7_9STRA|nr:unnamed protein product [Phytophthora lilii]
MFPVVSWALSALLPSLAPTKGNSAMLVLVLLLIAQPLLVAGSAGFVYQRPLTQRTNAQGEAAKRIQVGGWDQTEVDQAIIDANVRPDYWVRTLDTSIAIDS